MTYPYQGGSRVTRPPLSIIPAQANTMTSTRRCLPATNRLKHPHSLPHTLQSSSKCFGHYRLNILGSIMVY